MRSLWEDIKFFWSDKFYAAVVSLSAVCSYGYLISHETIGIDDTCIPLYFEEGLAPAVGRWTLYLINKIFHLSDFAPWVTEIAGVLLLMLAATIWCVVFFRILGRRGNMAGYVFFASLFLSCPLISEIYVYYLHNGISLAYVLTGIVLLLELKAAETENERKKRVALVLGASALLTVALGCYESFMMVYIVGMLLAFILARGFGDSHGKYDVSPFRFAGMTIATGALSVCFRWLVLKLVLWAFRIRIPDSFLVEYRSVFSFGDVSSAEFFMNLKRFWLKYYLNAFAYLPIAVLVFGIFVLLAVCVVRGLRKRDVFLPLAALAVPLAPACMVVIEGKETYYRASQYVPLVGAFAVFLLLLLIKEHLPGGCFKGAVVIAAALLWNQCAEMNQWFYADDLKYQDARNVLEQVAFDLEKGGYDVGKPIVFRGAYFVPYGIAKDAYLSYDSAQYQWILRIGNLVDPHLVEKYNAEDKNGYVFAETPVNSALRWGATAFDGTGRELGNFMRMLGYEFVMETDLAKIEEAQSLTDDMKHFPENGYIKECEEYIIVNF